MSTQDWSRLGKGRGSSRSTDANSVPIGPIVSYFGGEVREGQDVSVKCCLHSDTRRSAVINTYNNLYLDTPILFV